MPSLSFVDVINTINKYIQSQTRERFFGWGSKQLNDFLVWEANTVVKNNQDNQIQSIIFCNMHFSKKVYAVYDGVMGKAPARGEFSRIFELKTLQSVRLLSTVSYGKKSGEQDALVAPPIILLGEQLLSLLLWFPRLCIQCMKCRQFNTFTSLHYNHTASIATVTSTCVEYQTCG